MFLNEKAIPQTQKRRSHDTLSLQDTSSAEKSTVSHDVEDPIHSENLAILLRNVSVKLDVHRSDCVLKDVNISVPQGKLTVIAGATGCGKSTLLKTIMGEVRDVSGTVSFVPRQFGYCDQTPWLSNTSIKANILGVNEYDEKRYQAALRACVLEQDLSELAKGDQSSCGSDGISLSGGQRARIVSGTST